MQMRVAVTVRWVKGRSYSQVGHIKITC